MRIQKIVHWPSKSRPVMTRYTRNPYGEKIGFLHAHEGGCPVLRGEDSRRTICGFFFKTKNHSYYFQWRRWVP